MDIGSRLGAVLYVGYFYSKANLIGIEINKYFSDLQVDMTSKFLKISDRVKVCLLSTHLTTSDYK